ncbi:hypothetical protein GLOIN_2v1785920 [Rhizophagus clarus]|uniref:Uncharacterized protein n=1 Tax=Rhizophagus clarus TaxID=94130 RepID=A0A8H3M349_9GLOM|nr:hypothetical protein GLOIN_2v1785920 [Rhizophagus clarus]
MVFPTTYNDEKLKECNKCKEKCQDSSRTSCCACRVISLEPDFLAQKGAIEELIENAGHKCIFFSKFHCELNFIKRYWSAAKSSQESVGAIWIFTGKVLMEISGVCSKKV